MNFLILLWILIAVLVGVVVIPFVIYMCIKLGVVGWHRGRRLAERLEDEENERHAKRT